MGLHSPALMGERILVFGGTGAGKTRAGLDIARWFEKTKSDSKVYVLDSEGAWNRMIEPELIHSGRVTVEIVTDFQGYHDGVKKFAETIENGDVLVLDSITPAWGYCQSFYTQGVYQDDLSSIWMKKAAKWEKEGKGKGGPLPDTDWGIVNGIWRNWVNLLLEVYLKKRCHVFATAYPDEVRDEDSQSIKDLFHLGVKPKGQKELSHWFDTALWLKQGKGGLYVATTFKDREVGGQEREKLSAADLTKGFVMGYLVPIAGWRLK